MLRHIRSCLFAGAAIIAHPAIAADALRFGAPPSWVHPQSLPPAKATTAPIVVLLNDQQVALEPGKITTFTEGAIKIVNAQGLAAGNLSIVWQPATDIVTVNKLQIRRGDKIIDVLAAGQTFTVLRRETNLDAATLDGTLTGTIQPEGLQIGDIIDFATTTEHSDPVLRGHVETMFGAWDGLPIEAAHAAISWPSGDHMRIRLTPTLPSARSTTSNGTSLLEISAVDVQPLVAPKGAPARFMLGRLAEASDFVSWSDLAALFAPLYRDASSIHASGPLHDEVEKIRSASSSTKARAEQALGLVQDRVRYVALLMGQGGYVPASAETTWSRRFGDCKAKTALLLGILHSLGIEAEPVLVQADGGDMIGDRLPMVALFNHVLVRAHVGGKDYWLDGTRTGDTNLDAIEVPDFHWGLPLIANAKLVAMTPAPLIAPSLERHVTIDASAGVFAPAPVTIDELYRGDTAIQFNTLYSALTAEQRDEQFRGEAKSYFDTITNASSSLQFDGAKRELRITMKGSARLNWKNSWLSVPISSVGFDPDFDRPAGPFHDVPVQVSHPRYVSDRTVIHLPKGFGAQQKLNAPVHETLAGVEYARSENVRDDVLTVDSSERSLVPEILYKDALAAVPRLRAMATDDVYIGLADQYRPTDPDFAALAQSKPGSSDDYLWRAIAYLNRGKTNEALSDLSAGLEIDPKDLSLLGRRILINTEKRNFAAAETDIAAVEAIDPGNVSLPGARAMIAEGKGDFQQCVLGYSKILEAQPDQTFALAHRAICESALGNNEAALGDSSAALKQSPNMIDLRVLRANIFMREAKRELVSSEAEAMTNDNPTSDYAWVGAAKTYAALGMKDRAMKAFDRALALKPAAYIFINRSAVRPRSDVKGRMADLDAALKLSPGDPDALSEKARLLSDGGDYKVALALLDRVRTDPSGNPRYDHYLQEHRALILYKVGRTAEAGKLLSDLQTNTSDAGELNNLCYDQATAGIRLDAALEACRAALKIRPDYSAYLDSLGMVLLKLGKLDEALDAFNRAIARNSGADSLMGRGFVYLRKGDRSRADQDIAAARKRAPDIDETFAGYGLKLDRSSEQPHSLSQGAAANP